MIDANAAMTDDEVLQFTQGLRQNLISTLCAEGKMPDDPKTQQLLLATLGDMDRTALTKKRLNNDTDSAEADRLAQLAIASIYHQVGNRSPFENGNAVIPPEAHPTASLPAALVEDMQIVPGEMDIGSVEMTYSQFMQAD